MWTIDFVKIIKTALLSISSTPPIYTGRFHHQGNAIKTTKPDYYQLYHDVARLIMGWPESLLADPHFPLPPFSTSRNDSSLVLEKLMALGGDVPALFGEAVLAMESCWLGDAPLHHHQFCITS